jgi:alkylation response protein AidB-like acyl-CoA dehydrogenase
VLAAGLLSNSSDSEAKARLLPSIASGEKIATVAITGERGLWTPEAVTVLATKAAGNWKLNGIASYVTSGGQADILLVVASLPAGNFGTFQVDPKSSEVTIMPLESWDHTLRLSQILLNDAEATPLTGTDWSTVEKMLDLARVALAGEQAGGARHVFDMTVDYIKTRVQFGRPVGDFQAMKHMAADLLVELESATSAARHAARAAAENAPEAEAMINLAAFTCADAFSQIAAASIQMHGGIAFTWEHSAHLYLRRARADAQLFGSSSFYRDRYVSVLEKAA